MWPALSLAQGQRQTGNPFPAAAAEPVSTSRPGSCQRHPAVTTTVLLHNHAHGCNTSPGASAIPCQHKINTPLHAWLTTCVLASGLSHPAIKLHPPARAAAGQPNACSAQPKSTLPRSLQSQNAAATPYRPSSWQVLLAWNPCDSACQASAAASKKAACMAVSLLQTCCRRAACCRHEASTRLALHHCRWLCSTCCCAARRCRKSAAAAAITWAAACRRCRQLRMWSSSAASGVGSRGLVLLLLLWSVSGCCLQSDMAPRACKAEMLSLRFRADSMAGYDFDTVFMACLSAVPGSCRQEMDDYMLDNSTRQTVKCSDCGCFRVFGVFWRADHLKTSKQTCSSQTD